LVPPLLLRIFDVYGCIGGVLSNPQSCDFRGIDTLKTYVNSAVFSMLSAVIAIASTVIAIFWLPSNSELEAQETRGLISVVEYPNLGKIEQRKLQASLLLRNELDRPVQIIKVRTTCRCTVAHAIKAPIEPREECELEFEWDTRGIRGSSTTGMIVHYRAEGDAMSQSKVFTISSDVQPRYDVDPAILSFGGDSPSKVKLELKDRTLGRQPVIKGFVSESPAVSVVRLSDWSVEVAFDHTRWKDSPGFRPNLKLSVDVESDPFFKIPIHVNR